MLSCCLEEVSGEGVVVFRVTDGRVTFDLELDPTGRFCLFRDEALDPNWEGTVSLGGGRVQIELSLFDQQLIVAVNRRPVVVLPFDDLPPEEPTSRPLAIGTRGLSVVLSRMRVYRDVYYTHPVGARPRSAVGRKYGPLDDEYFVLGDNPAVSDDSRTWPQPGVPASQVVGKPLVVHLPARCVRLGRRQFQVPDLARIRYIR